MRIVGRWVVALAAAASTACAAVEGLEPFSACSSDCPRGPDATGGQYEAGGPVTGAEGSDASVEPDAIEGQGADTGAETTGDGLG
ncbi:MAG: hypothetical protein ACRENE_10210, partial [Polyangiaceae bacterium]